jgi:hypothetical protein
MSFISNGATLNIDRLSIQSDKDVARVCLEDYAKNLTLNDVLIKGEVYVYDIIYRGDKYVFEMTVTGTTLDHRGNPKLVNIQNHIHKCNISPNRMEHYKEIEADKNAIIARNKELKKAQNKLDKHCVAEFEQALSTSPAMDNKFIRGAHNNSIRETSKEGNILDVSVYWNYDGALLNDKHMNVYVSCSFGGKYISHVLSPKDLANKEAAEAASHAAELHRMQGIADRQAAEQDAAKKEAQRIIQYRKEKIDAQKKAKTERISREKYDPVANNCLKDAILSDFPEFKKKIRMPSSMQIGSNRTAFLKPRKASVLKYAVSEGAINIQYEYKAQLFYRIKSNGKIKDGYNTYPRKGSFMCEIPI